MQKDDEKKETRLLLIIEITIVTILFVALIAGFIMRKPHLRNK